MAIITNTFSTYSAIGNREDLSDMIYTISPTDTPFMSMIASKGKATSTTHEWQTDALAAATSNKKLEGDDLSSVAAATATVRHKNTVQLSYKAFGVTTTQRAMNPAGRKDELAYQAMKSSKELKRDIEVDLCGTTAARVTNPSATVARGSRSLENFLITNTIGGASYTNVGIKFDGTGTDGGAITTGTARVFTELLLKTEIANCYTQGGDPDVVMLGTWNKQTLSSFSGNATRFDKSEDKKLVTSVDFYVSDFGELRVIPNRFSNQSSAFVLQSDMFCVDYLENYIVEDLAKIGLSDRKVVRAEWTLRCGNEASSGAIASLTTA